MAKRLNSDIQVGMSFVADTSSAQKAIQQLNSQIDSLMTKHSNPTNADFTRGLTEESKKAQAELAKLKVSLEGAVNANTGKLDLSQFHQSLKASGTNLSQLKENLSKFGVAGDKAFANLTKNIISAEAPLRKTNGLLTEFATTLKNTARWQISSSILHGFMGSIQHAYYYAQDLNESLNNIRIVTSNSTDEMARFAKQANEAAKSLSTTTTQYTDAALIYYQQGLNDKQVKERTDVTMKMANVAGESAQTVSDQMTAVWNNFDDGSQSLEHYADVLTALGAATASSTSEITEGLEKFAATANTVGLSYEYATSALATVTATTRQSADVVGTSFKTLFARIQGLQLGDTLDDGTDLNKYSKALASVGISIKEENGEMKKMDTILDEMGAKWGTLAKDQQVALAETVAGVRQYTQMIALMDHWDFFKQNLETANNSTGALQDQADIYAESWEAASKRVKAAAETIYSDLLNDDFFISLTDGLAKVLEGVDGLIKGLGGVPGILTLTGTIATKVFQQQIAGGIKNLGDGLKTFFGGTKDSAMGLKKEANDLMKDNPMGGSMVSESAKNTMNAAYKSQIEVQDMVIEKTKNLSTEQQKVVQQLQKQHQLSVDIAVETAEAAEAAEKEARAAARRVKVSNKGERTTVNNTLKEVKGSAYLSELAQNTQWHNQGDSGDVKKAQEQALAKLNAIDKGKLTKKGQEKVDSVIKALQGEINNIDEIEKEFAQFCEEAQDLANDSAKQAERLIGEFDNAEKAIETARNSGEKESENDRAGSVMENSGDAVKDIIKEYNEQPMSFGDKFAVATQGAMAFAGALTSVKAAWSTFTDETASDGEKVEAAIMGISTAGMELSMVPWSSVGAGLTKIGAGLGAAETAALGVGAAFAGIAAAAAIALGFLVKYAVDMHHFGETAEGALEKTKEATQGLKQQAESTRQEVESLRSSFDNYQSVIDTLNSCKKGTEEWDKALQDVNSTVMGMMSDPNLMSVQGLFKNEDGHLSIDEDLYKQQIEKKESAQQSLQSAAARSQARQSALQAQVDFKSSYDSSLGSNVMNKGLWEGLITDFNEVGNGKVIRDAFKTISDGAALSKEQKEALAEVADNMGTSLESLTTEIISTAEQVKNANIQLENLKQIDIANLSKGTKYENDEKGQKELAEVYDDVIQKRVNELTEKYNKDGWGNSSYEKDILNLYNKATGNNYEKAEYTGNKNHRKVEFENADGTKETLNFEAVVEAISQSETTIKEIEKYIADIKDNTERLKTKEGTTEEQKSNLDTLQRALSSGDMNNLSVSDFKNFGKDIDWDNVSNEELDTHFEEMFGTSMEDAAKQFGMSVEELADHIIKAHEKTESTIKNSDLGDSKELYGLDTKGKSVETLSAEKNAADNAFTASGEKARDALVSVFSELPLNIQDEMKDFDWSSVTDLDSVKEAFEKVGYTVGPGSEVEKNLQAYIALMNKQAAAVDAATVDDKRKQARADEKAIEEVKANGSLSADSYGGLSEDLKEFFTEAEDGTYRLTASTEEWSAAVEKSQQAYENAIKGNQKVIDDIEDYRKSGGDTTKDLTIDASTMEGKEQQQAQLKSQIDAIKMLAPEVSEDQIAEFRERAKSESEEEIKQVSADILSILKEKISEGTSLDDAEEAAKQAAVDNGSKDAFLAKNGAELDEKLDKGEINKDAYNNALNSMNNTIDADLDAGKVKEYGEAISDAAKDSEVFHESLKDNEEAAEDVAESLMRCDDAVKDITGSYEEWKTAIENIEDSNGVLDPEVLNELTDAYGDMFDMDASQLSDEFLTNAENLELLKQAANGSAEAYDELQKKAQNDILMSVGLKDDDLATIQDKINSFVDSTDFQELEVGANINDTKFLNSLAEMLSAAGATASQAQAILSTMGIDAEVKQEVVKEKQNIPVVDVVPVPGMPTDIKVGDDFQQIQGYSMNVNKSVEPVEGFKTVTSLKINSAKKSAGGDIKLKKASAPGGGGGGGGGKGKKGSSAPAAKKVNTKTDIDRYWDINNAISKTSHEMEKLAKAKERMSGTELIDALTKENKLLEQQKKNYQALLKEQQKELSEVISKLKKKGGSFSGNKLKNYKGLMTKAGKKLEKARKTYNKNRNKGSKKEKNKNKEKWNKAQKEYENTKKTIDRYQQLQYDAIEETKAKMEELLVQEIENNFQKFEIKIKVKADMQDLKKDLNDIQTLFKTDFTKAADDAANWAIKMNGAAKNFSTLFSGKTMEQNRKEAQDKLDKYNVKASADQILAAQHEDNKKALQTKADKDYESAKASKAKKLVKKLGKKQRKKLYKKFGGKKNLNKKIDKGDKKAIDAAFKADFNKKENARIKKLKKKDLKKLKKTKGKAAKAKIKKKTYKKKKFTGTDKTSWAKKKKKKINKKLNKDIAADKKKLGVKGLKVKEVTDPLGKLVQNFGSNSALTSLYDQFTKLNAEKDHFMNGGKKDKTFISTSLSDATEKLKENGKQILDELQKVYNQAQEVWNTWLEGIDNVVSAQEKIREQLNTIYDNIESRGNIIGLLWDADSDKYLEQNESIIQQKMRVSEKDIETLKNNNDYWKGLQKEITDKGGSTDNEDWQKIQDQINKNETEILKKTAERIQLSQELRDNSIKKQLNTMDKGIWGDSFENVKQNWEESLAFQDEYLSKAQATYKIQSLSNTIQKDIDNTKDLKIQQKLNDFREEEIAHLREKNKLEKDSRSLTQDDVDLAQARYDILLKEIALENARNNKNSMKVVRNQEGNWSYQYVADNGDIEDKQQQLLDAWAVYNEKADEAQKHATQLAMNQYEAFKEAYTKMAQDRKYYNEQGLFDEAKFNDDKKALQDKYMAHIKTAFDNSAAYQKETTYSTVGTLAQAYELDKQNVESYTEKEVDAVLNFGNAGVSAYDGISKELTKVFGPGEDGEKAINAFNEKTIPLLGEAASKAGSKWGTATDTAESETFCGYFNTAMDGAYKIAKQYFGDKEGNGGINQLLKDGNTSATELAGSIDKVNEKIGAISDKNLKDLQTDLKGATGDAQKAASAIQEIGKKIEDVTKELEEVAKEAKAVGDAAKEGAKKASKPTKYSKKWYKSEIKTYKGFKNAKTNEAKVDYLKGLYKDKKNDKEYQGWLKEQKKLKSKMGKTKKEKARLKKLNKKIKHRKNYLAAIDALKKKYAGKIEGASKAVIEGGTDNQTNDTWDAPASIEPVEEDDIDDDDDTQTGTDAETIQDGVAAGLSSVLPNDFAQNVMKNTADALQQQQALLDKTDENTPKIAENTANLANVTSEVKGTINNIQRSVEEDIKTTLLEIFTSEKDFISKFDLMSENLKNKEFNNIYNINADFPNAKDVDTIKQAILSLPNLVSQKNNSKTKKKK